MKKPDGKLERVLRRAIRKWVKEKPTARRRREAREVRFLLKNKDAILIVLRAFQERFKAP